MKYYKSWEGHIKNNLDATVIISPELWETIIKEHNRLVELENKIENGTLIEIPCKVGDTVYFETWEDNDNTSIGVKGHKIVDFEINAIINGKYVTTYIPMKAVGIDVFLTKAEAEQKLKELQE